MQWVNFYLDEYRPKPLTFDSHFALLTFAVIATLILMFGLWQEYEVSRFNKLVAQKQQQVKQTEVQIKAIQASLKAIQQKEGVDQALNKKRQELKALSQIVSGLSQKAAQQAIPYSQIMTELGERSVEKLWLTQIQIEEGVLTLQGSTTKRETIAGYIEQLNQTSALNREFSGLTIEKDDNNRRIVHFRLDGGIVADTGAQSHGG